jgi:hypothetical protein
MEWPITPQRVAVRALKYHTQAEELAGSRLATSAQPPRATSPFSCAFRPNMRHSPCDSSCPLKPQARFWRASVALTASRPLPTPNEFQGKTMPRFLLITDSRLSENDRQNVFLEELTVGPQLYPRSLLELGQDLAQSFSCAFPDEVWA